MYNSQVQRRNGGRSPEPRHPRRPDVPQVKNGQTLVDALPHPL